MEYMNRNGQSPCQRLTHWNDTLQVQPRAATITQTKQCFNYQLREGYAFSKSFPIMNHLGFIFKTKGHEQVVVYWHLSAQSIARLGDHSGFHNGWHHYS